MPKAKPDQVVVHRIEFQESERELLSSVTTAYSIGRIAEPLVKLLNDVTGTITVLTLLAASGILAGISFTFIYDPDAITDPLEQWLGQYQEAKEQAELAANVYSEAGGPLRGLIDLIEYATGVNVPDFGAGYEPGPPSLGSQRFNDPNDFLSEAWFAQFQSNPAATTPLWNEGVPTGPVQEDGTF